MNVVMHSVKYPPKKDGTYYFITEGKQYIEKKGISKYLRISTIEFTVESGWNTSKYSTDHAFELDGTEKWAEIHYVDD